MRPDSPRFTTTKNLLIYVKDENLLTIDAKKKVSKTK